MDQWREREIWLDQNKAISQAPTLVNPNYEKDFILYTLRGDASIYVVVTQLNQEGLEQQIAFFNEGLKEYELRYNYVEKQVIIVVSALKKFRHILSNNRSQLLVPHSNVKDFLINKDIGEKRVGWITKVMDYDLDIKIKKLVRGRGLYEQFNSSFGKYSKVSLLLQEEEQMENQENVQSD